MSDRPHFLFADRFDERTVAKARAVGRVTILQEHDEEKLTEAVADCDALLVRTRCRVTRRIIDAATRLRVIGRAGVGLDNIDLEAAQIRGIAVVCTPDAATDAVADLAVGMMLALIRRLFWYDSQVRAARFDAARVTALREMADLTVGIVGFGRIGQAVGHRCRMGFSMRVLYNDIVDVAPPPYPALRVEKAELFRHSDVVSLHVPLTDATRGMINERVLADFKPGAILINTARGGIADAAAVAAALRSGQLSGAGLDVFEQEPLDQDDPLLAAPNALLTPHIGARTDQGMRRMDDVIDRVIEALKR